MDINTPVDQQLTPPGGWKTPDRVRLAPLRPEECGLRMRIVIWVAAKKGKLDASNLFLMLARDFRLFWAWLNFAKRMMPFGALDRRDTELAILRVAWNCRSRYEWGQHVDIGLRVGLHPREIARVPLGPDAPDWEPRQAAVLNACDELHQERMVSEDTWQQLIVHYNEKEMLEVLMMINHYEMIAGILNSTGLPLDDSVEDALAAAPIHQAGQDKY